VAKTIGARGYYETSALRNQGVDAVFEAATRAAIVVRDQGFGGVGGDNKRDTVHSMRREKSQDSKMGCCIIA
jgi:Rho family protein